MSKIKSFFLLKSKLTAKDFMFTLVIFIFSVALSFFISSFITKFLNNDIYFNIYNGIPITQWLVWLFSGVISIALLRTVFITIVTKFTFKKIYYIEIFLHTLKYALLMMPIFITMIALVGNKIFEEVFLSSTNSSVKLYLVLFISIILYLLIWVFFLGTTTKIFLKRKYSTFKSFIINISISFFTTITLMLIGSNFYTGNISKYEIQVTSELLKSVKKNIKLIKGCNNKSTDKCKKIIKNFELEGDVYPLRTAQSNI